MNYKQLYIKYMKDNGLSSKELERLMDTGEQNENMAKEEKAKKYAKKFTAQELKIILRVMSLTGVRFNELRLLKVDLKNGVILVPRKKKTK